MHTTNTPKTEEEYKLLEAESFSPGLSDAEVYAILDINPAELSDAKGKDFERAMIRGRALSKKVTMDHLFNSMKSKGGEKACVDYLRRFADEWPADEEYASSTGGTFTVNLG